MDAEILDIVRVVFGEGDESQAPRLVAALARRDGDPETRLRKLLSKTNKKCAVPDSAITRGDYLPAREGSLYLGGQRVDMPFHQLSWRVVESVLGRVLKSKLSPERAAWEFGPSHWVVDKTKWRDATALCAVRLCGLVVVGVGVTDAVSPSIRHAWPGLRVKNKDLWPQLRAWVREIESIDRVFMTVEQARALARGRKKARARS